MDNFVSLRLNPEGSREQIMDTLRDALYAHGDIEKLSLQTGLSKSTLHSIRSGRTQWPRHNTIFKLCRSLGLQLVLKRVR